MASTKGRIRLPGTLADYLRYVEKTFVVLPITGAIAERSILLSDSFSKEPADRLIAATAIVHGLTLVTKDEKIRKSGEVPCIW
jgi:PIN domain nuclease of toxin-antitoxin system